MPRINSNVIVLSIKLQDGTVEKLKRNDVKFFNIRPKGDLI